jgi:hypothetical protein
MDDQQIYALMAKTPKIRPVQIADALDQELDDVKEKLRYLVAMGNVVQRSGFSPNGHAAQVYDLSEQFKCSREGSELLGHILSQVAPIAQTVPEVPTQAPTIAPTPAPSAAPVDTPAPATKPAKDEPGRAARALAFIETHGSATDAQLRALMGLPDDVWPSTYLSKDAQAGRVVKVGHEWRPGNGKPLRKLKRQPAFGGPLSLPGASPFDVPAPAPAVPKVKRQASKPVPADAPEPAPAAPAHAAPPLRCGVWLDGVFELRRGGVTTEELTQAEALVIRDFLNRVLPAAASSRNGAEHAEA